jgi:aryl-alcohol dehydrogenase-like predicted oxidoreductase
MANDTFKIGGELEVHRLGYGAMRITGDGIWGDPADPDESRAVLRRAVELGVDFIDTADSYGPFVSEDLIREALHDGSGYGDVVVATKGGLTRQGPNKWLPVGRTEYLQQCVEMSLRRLGVETIDLWQLHRIDSRVPREEQFEFLAKLKQRGKARHIGLSEVTVEEIEAAREHVEIATVQNLYNLTNRKSEDVLEYCEREGIGFIPWFPLQAGELAKPGGPVAKAAEAHDVTPGAIALAWLLQRSPVMLPIPGTGSVAHLEENMQAASLQLSDDEVAELDGAAAAA